MKESISVIFILLFMGHLTGFSQSFYFTHYQVDDGLSNNAVLCAMQDKPGFMWFGTRDGLNRFDGLSYKIFRNNPADSNSIGSNAIMCLSEAEDNKIWVGTERGLYIFDERTERFTKFDKAGSGAIQALKIAGDRVFYITLYVLYSYNIRTKEFKAYSFPDEITAFSILKNKQLWVASSSGVVARFNPDIDKFDSQFNVFSRSGNPVSLRIQSLCDAGDGRILIGTSHEGLKLLNIHSGHYENILAYADKTDVNVMDILPTGPDEYWVATQSGIFIVNIKTNQHRHLKKDDENPYSLSNNIVQSLYKDNQNGIWASTYFGGVNYFSKDQMVFKKYFPRKSRSSVSGYAIGSIEGDKNGNIWIATEDAGLNLFHPANEKFTRFDPSLNKNTLTYSNVQCLLVSGDSVWAGTFLHGLDLLSLNGNRIKNYNTLNSKIGSNFADALLKTSEGHVLAGTDKGVYQFNRKENNFERITSLPQTFFRALKEDNEGNIWAGTYGAGIYQYNPKNNKVHHYLLSNDGNYGTPGNIINYIYCDQDIVWMATEGGLVRFTPHSGKWEVYTTQNNLPANVIYTILKDDKENLWLSTSKGLARFSLITHDVRVFSKSDGLLTDQFNYRSSYKDKEGNMYFGSVKGLISFHPDSIRDIPSQIPIYITGFQVYNKELSIGNGKDPLTQSIIFTPKITLPHNQSSFSIDFAALDYSSPLTIKYAYKLEGLDKSWNYLSSNRKAYFTEIQPGHYTFIVKNNSGQNSEPSYAALKIEILPPFWLTWKAYIAYILGSLILIYSVIMFFVNRSRDRHKRKLEKMAFEKEKELYRDKIDFFTNVAHEIKTPLTLIRGPLENIMDEVKGPPSVMKNLNLMNQNTDRLTYLANQILDFRKIEQNSFHLYFEPVNVNELLENIYLRFKSIAAGQIIRFELNIEDKITAQADREALTKIFSNLIGNALKYTSTQVMITLKTEQHKNKYRTIITNDGALVPPEEREKIFESFYRVKDFGGQAGTGIGLTLSRTLAEMHKGTLILETEMTAFNTFILELPKNPKDEKEQHP